MTKYEVLEKYCANDGQYLSENEIDGNTSSVTDAMDEYAKQEAIEFAKWKEKESWYYMTQQGKYANLIEISPDANDEEFLILLKTTDELYELFILYKQKQP